MKLSTINKSLLAVTLVIVLVSSSLAIVVDDSGATSANDVQKIDKPITIVCGLDGKWVFNEDSARPNGMTINDNILTLKNVNIDYEPTGDHMFIIEIGTETQSKPDLTIRVIGDNSICCKSNNKTIFALASSDINISIEGEGISKSSLNINLEKTTSSECYRYGIMCSGVGKTLSISDVKITTNITSPISYSLRAETISINNCVLDVNQKGSFIYGIIGKLQISNSSIKCVMDKLGDENNGYYGIGAFDGSTITNCDLEIKAHDAAIGKYDTGSFFEPLADISMSVFSDMKIQGSTNFDGSNLKDLTGDVIPATGNNAVKYLKCTAKNPIVPSSDGIDGVLALCIGIAVAAILVIAIAFFLYERRDKL